MTLASFSCIPPKNVERFRRPAGSYDAAGDWVTPVAVQFTVQAVLHPISGKTRLSERMIREIDGNRSRKWIVLYAEPSTFQTEDEPNLIQADHLEINGERFEVMQIDDWDAGVLDHQKVLAGRLDVRDSD